ncbi:protein of unknown function [Methylotuvimicrobium alcaliphilum 20Z]|uniref:Uncharacterized protein n=1 Tax=Methylotuvimicrobium alcaliphilum (strain DSM 19304 / NCIMB 14124 / VKM B-2133 / 20Z) TaxID=1091494 RepID=G4T012_META2|nr:protein of unknown function [Methylotuvimicrobium alcaliphilum 20Z]
MFGSFPSSLLGNAVSEALLPVTASGAWETVKNLFLFNDGYKMGGFADNRDILCVEKIVPVSIKLLS